MKRVMLGATVFWAEMAFGQKMEWEGQAAFEAASLQKPKDSEIFAVDQQNIIRGYVRGSVRLSLPSKVRAEVAVYGVGQELKERDDFDHIGLNYTDPRHRSSFLDQTIDGTDRRDFFWMMDRLNLTIPWDEAQLTIGRQPVDLSRSFIFRPADIFAPSRLNQLDRSHKFGVDAIQFTQAIKPLGTWKLLAVAGYEEDLPQETDEEGRILEPTNRYAAAQSSVLASYGNTFLGSYLQIAAGSFRKNWILLASMETEITEKVGGRLEARHTTQRETRHQQLCLVAGMDLRVTEALLLMAEAFWNGDGVDAVDETDGLRPDPYAPVAHSGRRYLGLGMNYEFTPVLKFSGMQQWNLSDASLLWTGTLTHSTTEALDLSLLLVARQGDPPREATLRSEYGSYPQAVAVEALYRW